MILVEDSHYGPLHSTIVEIKGCLNVQEVAVSKRAESLKHVWFEVWLRNTSEMYGQACLDLYSNRKIAHAVRECKGDRLAIISDHHHRRLWKLTLLEPPNWGDRSNWAVYPKYVDVLLW